MKKGVTDRFKFVEMTGKLKFRTEIYIHTELYNNS